MSNLIFTNFLSFTEWYHYAILFSWIIMLFTGIKYFHLLESYFKPKDGFDKGEKYGKNILVISFVIGVLMVIIFTFKPVDLSTSSELNWTYSKYLIYISFILLLVINAFVSIQNYKSKSNIFRLVIMSFLMILYFYTGMLGGLLILATFVLFILIYALFKLKNTLSIK